MLTLVLSIAAGAAVPWAVPHVARALARVLDEGQMPDVAGLRVAAFGLLLLAVAVVLELGGEGASPVLLLLGGIVGVFQAEIRRAILDRMD